MADLGTGTIDAVGVRDHATADVVAVRARRPPHRARRRTAVSRSLVRATGSRATRLHRRRPGRVASRAPFEDLAGRGGADDLVGVELVAVDAEHSDRPRARTEGDVPVGGAGRWATTRAGARLATAAVGEEALQVGGVDGVELGPGDARAARRRAGVARGPASAAAADRGTKPPPSTALISVSATSTREPRFIAVPPGPASSNAPQRRDPFDQPAERHELGREVGGEQHGGDRDAGRRRRVEHDGEAEDRAEDVRAGVTEHQPLAQVVAGAVRARRRRRRQLRRRLPGPAHEHDRHVAEQRELVVRPGARSSRFARFAASAIERGVDERLDARVGVGRGGEHERERRPTRPACRARW